MSNGFNGRRNPHRLYRDRDNAIIAGVCAGLADYFGFNTKAVRVITGVSALVFLPFVAVSYAVLAILLPVKPESARLDEAHAQFWRGVSNAPSDVFSNVRHRFREIEMRLQRMEAYVTSREFEIDRELNRAKDSPAP